MCPREKFLQKAPQVLLLDMKVVHHSASDALLAGRGGFVNQM